MHSQVCTCTPCCRLLCVLGMGDSIVGMDTCQRGGMHAAAEGFVMCAYTCA